MSDIGVVTCDRHGQVQAAYVCQHLFSGLKDRQARGVHWVVDENDAVNAWCDGCETFLLENGGAWNDTTEAHANIKLICRNCFDEFETFENLKEVT